MSCQKIDDLQDLASNLFEFDQQQQMQPKRERTLKKQRKPKNNPQSTIETKQQNFIANLDYLDKPLGSHSIYVKTFGCSHNISDSQFMIGQLSQYGYKIVDNSEEADLILINSCTVVNPSQDAFISMVCKAKKIKKPLVVAGCVPQGEQNIPELAEISAVGVTQIDRIVQVVEQTLKGHKVQLMQKKDLPSLDLPKIRKNKDIEIITINAGCLGACTYCKTVFARGRLLSYAPQAIIHRVNNVVKEGVRQIWLTSEDTGAYGRDINSNISQLLVSLCQQLKNHKKIMMRIGMTNPPYMLDQLSSIAHFLNHPRVFSFIHIPIQAGHNNVLEKMNRQYTVQQFRQVVDYFLQHVPDVTIATDIICGFAQETDQQFQASLKLIDQYKFRVVNINQFYLRPGTSAANLIQLPSKVVKSRSSKLTELFKSFNKSRHTYMIDREQRVWINEIQTYKNQKHLVGHTKNYTKVILPFKQQLLYKQVIMKITHAYDWHIEGQIINDNPQDLEISDSYVQNMKNDIQKEKETIKNRKQAKIIKMKERKYEKLSQLKNASEKQQKEGGCSNGSCGSHSTSNGSCCSNGSCACNKKQLKQTQSKNQLQGLSKQVSNQNNTSLNKTQAVIMAESQYKNLGEDNVKPIKQQIKLQYKGTNSSLQSEQNKTYLYLSILCMLIGISLLMYQ